jgi:prepilin-type N-terminal cleavage/methylation domain-containing protein
MTMASDGVRRRPDWRVAVALMLAVVFIYAAASKLHTIYSFEDTIETLLGAAFGDAVAASAPVRRSLTVAIIFCEVVVGLALVVFCRSPRQPALGAAVLLLAFSIVLLYMATMEQPPSCGCLGAWELGQADARRASLLGLGRNSGLLILACWLAMAATPSSCFPATRSATRAGFTLVELLVVLVVVAVVIAITIPALSSARRQGRSAESLSTQRACQVGLSQYAQEQRGYLPFLGTPGEPDRGILSDRAWSAGPPVYLRGHSVYWPTSLLSVGIDLTALPGMTQLPAIQNDPNDPSIVRSSIWLTHAASARPAYWIGADYPESARHYSGVRMDEAVFPSSKGLLADLGLLAQHWTDWWSVGLVDGSATVRSRVNPPVKVEMVRPYGAVPWRVLTTVEGMRGIDY